MAPLVLSDKVILRFRIPTINLLQHRHGEYVTSSRLSAHGQEWALRIYPNGCDRTTDDESRVSIYLLRVAGKEKLKVNYSITKPGLTRDARDELEDPRVESRFTSYSYKYKANGDPEEGPVRHIEHSEIFSYGNGYFSFDGTLILDAMIRVYAKAPSIWYPPLQETPEWLQKMMETAKFSDVSFVVSGREFALHRFILDVRAPALYALCLETAEAVELDDVDPEKFQSLVKFIYSNETPSLDSLEEAKAFLLLADRFCCKDLKLFAESTIVEKHLQPSNAAELFLFSHDHTCALLKESAVMLCAKDAKTVAGTEGWKLLKETPELLAELFVVSHTKRRSNHQGDPDLMSVADLRNKLLKRKHDMDGSREMLMKRLKSDSTKPDEETIHSE